MAKSNHSQRRQVSLMEENTKLKRRVARLEVEIFHWKEWVQPISMAIMKGDNLRAIALMKERRK